MHARGGQIRRERAARLAGALAGFRQPIGDDQLAKGNTWPEQRSTSEEFKRCAPPPFHLLISPPKVPGRLLRPWLRMLTPS